MKPPRYTSHNRRASQSVANALHEQEKKRFRSIQAGEGISFDTLTERTKPQAACETCGKPLELDLWQKLVCGYCGGWRSEKPTPPTPDVP
jgi:Zn finger protein HypA/HybF involved in hydrogenase expression